MLSIKSVQQIKAEIQKLSPHPEKVKLLAVSKKQTVEKIQALLQQNHFYFGENYVQEALEKMQQLPKNIEWHLLGHVQSKKVNSIVGKFAYIHSVDSLKIAELIGQKSKACGLVQNIFIELNLGNEDTKTGFTIDDLRMHWAQLTEIDSLRIYGLMALPPPSDDQQVTRLHFRTLHNLQHQLRQKTDTSRHPLNDLSMGTSQDFSIALQEGSTLIRIGTALFGERI